MTARNFFHIGILVNDLDAAIKRFSEVLELTFVEPTVAHVEYLEEDGRGSRPADIRVSYAQQGPPYYELLEAHNDGIYGRQHGEGVHHVGAWEPHCEQRLKELVEKHHLRAEATQYTPDRKRIIVSYFYPDGFHGVRLEILDEGRRKSMESWISGGTWAD
jgi:catechol 2,3-dioxygenase-like lactoylglutathione lyase family enzyme